MKPSGIKPPSTFTHITSPPPRALRELDESNTNTRTTMPPPAAKHKPSGCKLPLALQIDPERSLTSPVPEPAYKQRKTLVEQGGEPHSRRIPAPPKQANSVRPAGARVLAASTSRATTKTTSRHPSAAALSGSVGAIPRTANGNVRPKSAHSQYGGLHSRSKSYQQGSRPATALMMNRDDDDDSEQAERKGVPPFHISTNPSASFKVPPKKVPPASKQRATSLSLSQQRVFHLSGPRAVSSPSRFRSIAPVIEEPADTDCDDICAGVEALGVGASKADTHGSRVRHGMTSDYGTNPFLKPKFQSLIPQPTPTPVRQQQVEQSPFRPPSTPRRTAPAPFINRFTNDRCPDFYNERMEAIERDFRMFKQKVESDVQQATDYKESIQQLQSRGMFHSATPLPCVFELLVIYLEGSINTRAM
jgi:kinesin family protein C1